MVVPYIVCSRTFQTTLISRNQNTATYLAVIIFIRKYTLGDSIRKQIYIYTYICRKSRAHSTAVRSREKLHLYSICEVKQNYFTYFVPFFKKSCSIMTIVVSFYNRCSEIWLESCQIYMQTNFRVLVDTSMSKDVTIGRVVVSSL